MFCALIGALFLAQTPIGLRPECADLRRGNNRMLIVASSGLKDLPLIVNGFLGTGWTVGVLIGSTYCREHSSKAGCLAISTWGSAPPLGVEFFEHRQTEMRPATMIGRAIETFRPAHVFPFLTADVNHIIEAAEELGMQPSRSFASHALNCSLPPERELWRLMSSKSGAMELMRNIGVPLPWHVRVCPPLSSTEYERIRLDAVKHLPVLFKTDQDGGGKGLSACAKHDAPDCVREAIRSIVGQHQRNGGGSCFSVEQYMEGITVVASSVAIDGAVVSTYVVAKVVADSSLGVTLGGVSLNDARILRYHEAIAARMRWTGFVCMDYRLSRNGDIGIIDANFRSSNLISIGGQAFGIVPHGLLRLREALQSSAAGVRTPYRAALLDYSISTAKISHKAPTHDLLHCADVFVQWQWGLAGRSEAVDRELRAHGLQLDARHCTVSHRGHRGVPIRAHCDGLSFGHDASYCGAASKSCVQTPRILPPINSSTVHDRVCSMRTWGAEHSRCLHQASSKAASPSADSPFGHFCAQETLQSFLEDIAKQSRALPSSAHSHGRKPAKTKEHKQHSFHSSTAHK